MTELLVILAGLAFLFVGLPLALAHAALRWRQAGAADPVDAETLAELRAFAERLEERLATVERLVDATPLAEAHVDPARLTSSTLPPPSAVPRVPRREVDP
ncbi:MAG: phage shock protein B [Sphingomonadaceae bacterium]|uniref:hypothetical protein n=1 Tax=Thermaurantiacus sp. TaxID=2820283 RepID=UPI00298F28DF|nr:hypothetical protein [Thermaurantiacus sp.]MCS6985911.1 phage shock protein B [Sphingomonadaceae bacterium]MDW8414873.1 hypothetical protein [Thermaurantiacus sp.]